MYILGHKLKAKKLPACKVYRCSGWNVPFPQLRGDGTKLASQNSTSQVLMEECRQAESRNLKTPKYWSGQQHKYQQLNFWRRSLLATSNCKQICPNLPYCEVEPSKNLYWGCIMVLATPVAAVYWRGLGLQLQNQCKFYYPNWQINDCSFCAPVHQSNHKRNSQQSNRFNRFTAMCSCQSMSIQKYDLQRLLSDI